MKQISNAPVFLTILLCGILFCYSVTVSKAESRKSPKSGPFYSSLVRTEKCKNTTFPYANPPRATFFAELYNTSSRTNLLRGNLSVHMLVGNEKVNFRGYYWQDNKWQIKYLFPNIHCNGPTISAFAKIFGFKTVNGKACSVPKGVHKFEGIDQNVIEHSIWNNERDYGRLMWRIESFFKKTTSVCWEAETIVVPA